MITYAGAKLAWEQSAALRQWTFRIGLSLMFFCTGWVSSCVHYNNAAGESAVKAVVKQSAKNERTLGKRIGEASEADAKLEENESNLQDKQENVNEAIGRASNPTECDLSDDELWSFNELAKATNYPR